MTEAGYRKDDGCSVVLSEAIDDSIDEDRVVWLDLEADSPVLLELFEACSGEASNTSAYGPIREYWGELENEDGSEDYWRIHVRVQS